MTDYRQIIRQPDKAAKGITRWWWYGCAVTEKEIDRELDFMHDAGMGGVELQILYAVEPDDPSKGIYNIPFGSPRFYEILAYTKAACDARDMTLDITPGSSWPFGGPVISDEDAQQEAIPYQMDFHGPQTVNIDFTTRFAGEVACATLGRMRHCVQLPDTVRDVTQNFRIKYLFGWPWGTELCNLEIPEGDWKLTFFVISMHRNHVGKPGRNAEGLVLDHCSKRAANVFFDNMVKPIAEHVPGVRSYFCDSIEVEGHNWSGMLLDEFAKRRGYSLVPYIYALWGDMGEITPRIRYDYFRTMGELTIENFFDKFTEFCHAHGSISRVQAHGTWGDILRVYGSADIPEGETFGDHRILEVNTIHRRLAASAGHIYSRPVISNETFTWLKRPRFTETLEEMKAAVDAVFCDGINMIVNHGYAYSPEHAGKRGYPFYASTHINHTTPWWQYYKQLGRYIHSVSAVLHRGEHVSEIAIYLPQADIYAENMMSELHLAMRLEEHIGRSTADRIQKAGYWFDYINDDAVKSPDILSKYKAVLLIGCSRMPAETAEKLRAYADDGGIIIAAENKPYMGCGLSEYESETVRVRNAFSESITVVPDRGEALISELGRCVSPDVIVSDNEHIGWVHRREDHCEIYFITNINPQKSRFSIRFRHGTGGAELLAPVTGKRMPFTRCDDDTFEIELCAHQSAFMIFDSKRLTDSIVTCPVCVNRCDIKGWKLRIPEIEKTYEMDTPVSWEKLEGLEGYSGTGIYSTDFECPGDVHGYIEADNVSCAAELIVNGVSCGVYWTHPLSLPVSLKHGVNHIELHAASTLINEMRIADGHNITDRHPAELTGWPYYGKVLNDRLDVRMNLDMERKEQKMPVPSGVWGNVCFVETE